MISDINEVHSEKTKYPRDITDYRYVNDTSDEHPELLNTIKNSYYMWNGKENIFQMEMKLLINLLNKNNYFYEKDSRSYNSFRLNEKCTKWNF
jgi:hypothetical protein